MHFGFVCNCLHLHPRCGGLADVGSESQPHGWTCLNCKLSPSHQDRLLTVYTFAEFKAQHTGSPTLWTPPENNSIMGNFLKKTAIDYQKYYIYISYRLCQNLQSTSYHSFRHCSRFR